MPKPLVFLMGRSPVFLPTDRLYARNHCWAVAADGGRRLGFSAYAVKLLGEVRRLQWAVVRGDTLDTGQQIGFIEASKATSDLYAPMAGRVVEINPAVLADPALINSNPYDAGWLMIVDGSAEGLLMPEAYLAHVEANWPLAQRLLKGQAGGSGE